MTRKVLGAVAIAALLGCDNKDTANGGPDIIVPSTKVTVVGFLEPHPASNIINLASGQPRLTWGAANEIIIQLADPVQVIANPTDYETLAEGSLDLTTCTDLSPADDGLHCPFSFADVEVEGLGMGLLGIVIDLRTEFEFVPTNVGLAAPETLEALEEGDTLEVVMYAVSMESVDVMAGFVQNANGAELLANGLLFGSTVTAGTPPQPVSGVTITVGTRIPSTSAVDIIYLNDDFDDLGITQATNSAGFFLGVTTPGMGAETTLVTLTPSSVDHTWQAVQVGTAKSTVFVVALSAVP